MFPTSTLPVSPFLGVTGMGTLLGLLALGAVVALIVGLVLHHREPQGSPAVDLSGADADGAAAPEAKSPGTRLSA
jgi:hypothetical protein